MNLDQFLKKHNINCSDYDIEKNLPEYLADMRRGLDGEASSLLMLPTYIEKCDNFPLEREIIAVDAGGTNLRICSAHFDKNKNLIISNLNRYTMPGVEKHLNAAQFFKTLAELIAPYCLSSNTIAMSFAYRAKTTRDHDAEIIEITKEVSVEGASGMRLASETLSALKAAGFDNMRMAVINDTVAVALSGQAEIEFKSGAVFTGTILGTGSNSCYFEKNSRIKKVRGLEQNRQMLINTESGSYNLIARSDLDIEFDKTTIFPDIGIFEKMTAGGYLGALTQTIIRTAVNEGVLEQQSLKDLSDLTTPDISKFVKSGGGLLSKFDLTENDAKTLTELIKIIIDRAAHLVALQMAAVIAKNNIPGAHICAAIEGSTYEKLTGLKPALHKILEDYWRSKGQDIQIITPEHAVLKGCAIAGLSVYPE